MNKLTDEQVIAILQEPRFAKGLCEKYGVSHSTISGIRHNKIHKHIDRITFVCGPNVHLQTLRARKRRLDFFDNSKIVKTETCWLYTGNIDAYGYGRLGSKNSKTHRIAYEQLHGPIPAGLVVLHICDVRNCVNPKHLRLGTPADNSKDAKNKGRMPRGAGHVKSKLKEEYIPIIKASSLSQRKLAKLFNVGRTTIRNVLRGNTWTHVKEREHG